jgi:HlyD family secretion protein
VKLAPSGPADSEQRSSHDRPAVEPTIARGSVPSPPARTMPKWQMFLLSHKWLLALAVVAVLVIAYSSVRYFKGATVSVDIVKRADLIETVVASGHVESPFRVGVASQITGTVVSVAVREGETVREGQPLIILAADELRNAAIQAQAAVAQAQAHVRQISELSLPQAIEAQNSAGSNLLATQQIFDRTSALMGKGFVTRAYFDDVKKNRDVARAQVATAAAQVRSARVGGSEFATAQADLMQARAGASAATSRLAYTTISAPRAGILISRTVERGMVVTPGAPLMALSPETATQIVLQIDERNLGKVAVGQPALVSADAYPQQRFAAIITFINPGIDITRASATVKLTVPSPPTYLRQDMTVSVDIETARHNAVLSLTDKSVHDALSSSPWIMTIEHGRAVRRTVRLGLHGNNRIEIISGVKPGTMIIPVASTVVAGARVSPVMP